MRAAARDARLADEVRDDPAANAFFLEVLTNKARPDVVLRWMNEAGVFGRFVPDFGRVVAQMQFDMYHHYTVDEHSIRAIGLTAAIERGELAEDHPLSTALFKQIASRRTLYVAVLLHDIAKGRGGDHSASGRRDRARAVPAASGSTPARPRPWRGWCGTTCCCRTPPFAATSPTPRRSTISSARCRAPSGCACC